MNQPTTLSLSFQVQIQVVFPHIKCGVGSPLSPKIWEKNQSWGNLWDQTSAEDTTALPPDPNNVGSVNKEAFRVGSHLLSQYEH